MVQRYWYKIAPYWHICMAIFWGLVWASWWIHDVSAYSGQISDNKKAITAQEMRISTQDMNMAVIKEQVTETHDQVKQIWEAMRLDRHQK